MNKLLTAVPIVLLGACSYTLPNSNVQPFAESKKVDANRNFWIAMPQDGKQLALFGTELHPSEDSGSDAQKAFGKAVSKKLGRVTLAKAPATTAENLKAAKANGDDYMISMDVHEWKDSFYFNCPRPNQNSGGIGKNGLDTADVTVFVYDVKSGSVVNKQRLTKSGCPAILFNFIPVGTNSPEGRFSEMLSDWHKDVMIGK